MLTIKRADLLGAIAAPDARPNLLLPQVPRRADFVESPSSWYLFCVARELDRGPLSKHMLGTNLVAYRTDAGRVVVMDGRCSHMRADLGKGKVVGDGIQCPFHGWRYGPDGHCKHIPRTDKIPRRARQRTYPVVERHGLVFVFNGPEPLFPLPFFFDERVEDFTPATPVEFVANCSWFLVAAHGYDSQHFETVHLALCMSLRNWWVVVKLSGLGFPVDAISSPRPRAMVMIPTGVNGLSVVSVDAISPSGQPALCSRGAQEARNVLWTLS